MTKGHALLVGHTRLDVCVRGALERLGWKIHVVPRADELAAHSVGTLVVISCDAASAAAAMSSVRALRAQNAQVPIVLTVSGGSEAIAVEALRSGVTDYVTAPWSEPELVAVLSRFRPRPQPANEGEPVMVGGSAAIRWIADYVETVGSTDTSVLITGETGTGKELVARLLHARSPRRNHPFVSINCAAIPDTLLESELFGHERGAFTGAHAAREGYLRAADRGTVLLDEIGEMTSFAQAKILRALDTREVYRLGSTRHLPLDVRVIASTNQELLTLIGEGRFRRDLYYRLNVARVRLPPLRERREDIPALIDHYVGELNHRFQRSVQGFTDAALQQMVEYDWPGNVREVRNMVEGAFAELPTREVTMLDTPAELRERLRQAPAVSRGERERLLAALVATHWNKSRAAEQLRWSRMTLYRKLAKYNLQQS